MPNRLANETSPYLLQHKDNPVDWYPWGGEALSRAQAEDRPILLSVGYSACHWCHVMEHESFANPDTAAIMNSLFVNIKVDREERPDIDAVYMQAVQQMTGHGGWPMTVFLRPDGSPFYGGTYFPPEPRHGMPSFHQILMGVAAAYRERRSEVDESAVKLTESLDRGMAVNPPQEPLEESMLHRAFHGIASRFDDRRGGFGGPPKFPQPMIIDFLLLYWTRTGTERALEMAERTLEAMSRGGIHDQLGGGFHRYTVDGEWLVPHFEKMLYDNALLAQSYLRAFQATGRQEFRRTAESILAYVEKEMRSPAGGFYSSQDADSEGEEGRFYVWSAEEIDSVLGPDDGPLFRRYYDVTPGGNWEGKNILRVLRSVSDAAAEDGVPEPTMDAAIRRGRVELYAVRAERVWPARDDKVLTSWNAMMLAAFADAARILDSSHYLEIAKANANFILTELRRDGTLLRTWRDGSARIEGFLEDHALLADGLLALYGASFDPRWVREARTVADSMIASFWSESEELFYDTSSNAERLVVRPRDLYDNATPSGTSAAVRALQRLAHLTGEPRYDRIANRVLGGLGDAASRLPQGFGNILCALAVHLAPPSEVAIVGDPDAVDTRELLGALRTRFLPFTTIALRRRDDTEGVGEDVPLLAHRTSLGGAATAYVCRNHACRQPVTSVDDLVSELSAVAAPGVGGTGGSPRQG